MSTSHTPGPWRAGRRFETGAYPLRTVIAVVGDGLVRAHVNAGPGIGGSAEADARLITAAPDLLEACEQAEHWLSQSDRSIEPTEMLRVLRAAIARVYSVQS